MPSLRRSFSAPTARSSPYPSSALVGSGRGHPRRPSSASDTSTRRVLADIDWWRVEEGQCDPALVEIPTQGEPEEDGEDADVETPQHATVGSLPAPAPALGAAIGNAAIDEPARQSVTLLAPSTGVLLERPTTPVGEAASPQIPFRAPRSRVLRAPARRHASESSISSVESSPDLPVTPRDHLSFFDPGFAVADSDDEMLAAVPVFLRVFPRIESKLDAKKVTRAPPSILSHGLFLHGDLFA